MQILVAFPVERISFSFGIGGVVSSAVVVAKHDQKWFIIVVCL